MKTFKLFSTVSVRYLMLASLLLLDLSMIYSCGKCDESTGQNCSTYNLTIPGVSGPNVNILGDTVLISMVFENLRVDGGLRYAVPKYKNSYIEVSPDLQSAGTMMAISVSLEDIFGGGLELLDPLTLPGGRPLPGVKTGRLPAVAFSIEQFKNMAFYLGPQVFGIFIPVRGLNMQGSMVTARFYSAGRRTGNISIIGEDNNGNNGGFLLMLDMNANVKSQLKKLI